MGTQMITYTIVGVPYYNYSIIMGGKTLFLDESRVSGFFYLRPTVYMGVSEN